MDLCGVVGEDRERRGGVPGLDHAVVAGHDHERDSRIAKARECVEYGGVGFRLWFYHVKEVARVDEHVRLLPDDLINPREEIVIDLLLAQVHAASGSSLLKAARPRWVSAMWMSFILLRLFVGGYEI